MIVFFIRAVATAASLHNVAREGRVQGMLMTFGNR